MDDVQSTQMPVEEVAEETQDYTMPNAFAGDEEPTDTGEEDTADAVVESTPTKEAKGDLSVALRKERELRRQREAELAQLKASGAQKQTPQAFDPSVVSTLVQQQLAAERSKEKAREVLPELKTDKELQVMVTSLMYDADGNMVRNAEQAAKIVAKRMGKLVEEKAESLASERSAVQNAKEQATTAQSEAAPKGGNTDIEELRARIKSSTNVKERAKLQAQINLLRIS